jgi:hypothetical protein
MDTTAHESCINKLLLVCFCLNVPVRETFAPVAVLMHKRILPDNIMEIAKLVNNRLVDYRRTPCGDLKESPESAEQKRIMRANAKSKTKTKLLYPRTIAQLEKKLDKLLGCLRAHQPPAWRQLAAAGLIDAAPATVKGYADCI